jgi:hypothetical protein
VLTLAPCIPEVETSASGAACETVVLPATSTGWLRVILQDRGELPVREVARLAGVDSLAAAQLLSAAARRGYGVVRVRRGIYALASSTLPPAAVASWRHATRRTPTPGTSLPTRTA